MDNPRKGESGRVACPWLIKKFIDTQAVVRGLKEFGEPAGKALIIAQAAPELRARTYSAYYLIRDCIVTLGSLLGAWLWSVNPQTNFVAAALLSSAASARAAGFSGRLYAGPGYMVTDTQEDRSDGSGVALLTQLDAGVQVSPVLHLHATLLYDHSSWMSLGGLVHDYPGSMLGFGLGATLALAGFRVGASAGGQFTSFTSADDPSSGPNGAGLGSFIAAHAGYVVPVALGTQSMVVFG